MPLCSSLLRSWSRDGLMYPQCARWECCPFRLMPVSLYATCIERLVYVYRKYVHACVAQMHSLYVVCAAMYILCAYILIQTDTISSGLYLDVVHVSSAPVIATKNGHARMKMQKYGNGNEKRTLIDIDNRLCPSYAPTRQVKQLVTCSHLAFNAEWPCEPDFCSFGIKIAFNRVSRATRRTRQISKKVALFGRTYVFTPEC